MRSVVVSAMNGNTVALEVEADCRMRVLKARLQAETGIPSAEMELLAGEHLLGPSDTLPLPEIETDGTLAPLQLALVRKRPQRLPQFLRKVGLESVTSMDRTGCTALLLAAHRGEAAVCMEILDCEDVRAVGERDFLGNSALHYAAERTLPDLCARLLVHPGLGDAVFVANRNGRTALHLAAMRGDVQTCRAILAHPLVEAVAARMARDALGCSAADLAASAGHAQLAQELLPPAEYTAA